MADGLESLVSPRFLSESLIIDAIYSITHYGLHLNPPGPSYSVNVHAGAHPRLSVFMGVPLQFSVSMFSLPVREHIPRHAVSYT
jgi:hypothetical protein